MSGPERADVSYWESPVADLSTEQLERLGRERIGLGDKRTGEAIVALITRLRAAEAATTPVRLRARRLALGMDVLTATRLVADVLGARLDRLEAVQQSKAAFLEASLMALEEGPFHGDPSECIAAYDAVLCAAEARTAWQPIETAPEGQRVLVCDVLGVGMATLTEGKWQDGQGYDYEPTHWQPLPAAPEAPHG